MDIKSITECDNKIICKMLYFLISHLLRFIKKNKK